MKTEKITRVELIDNTKSYTEGGGRLFSLWDCECEISLQDDGRTLKVFITKSNEKSLHNKKNNSSK